MIGTDLVVAVLALFGAVLIGTIAHESSHAIALRFARIEYTVEYLPQHSDGFLDAL